MNLPVDPGFAFDYLAILQVKSSKGLVVSKELILVGGELKRQCPGNFEAILDSPEYYELLEANRVTFELVDLAKIDQCKASEVDQSNYRRYLAKVALQERFWPANPVLERKTER